MSDAEKLAKIFGEFPGIGPRQAKRFVYFLMTKSPAYIEDLLRSIKEMRTGVNICQSCKRIYQKNAGGDQKICNICADANRDKNKLMIVARDIDFETMEKSKIYKGLYFILGGTIPYLEKEPEQKVRSLDLEKLLKESLQIDEVIISMNATPDGDHTAMYINNLVKKVCGTERKIMIYTLGRGLSTGSELEYADRETISNALANKVKM